MFPLKGGGMRLKINQVMVPSSKKGFLQHAAYRQAKGLSLDSNFHLMAKVRGPVHSKRLSISIVNPMTNRNPWA